MLGSPDIMGAEPVAQVARRHVEGVHRRSGLRRHLRQSDPIRSFATCLPKVSEHSFPQNDENREETHAVTTDCERGSPGLTRTSSLGYRVERHLMQLLSFAGCRRVVTVHDPCGIPVVCVIRRVGA